MQRVGIAGSGRVGRPFLLRMRDAGLSARGFALSPLDDAGPEREVTDAATFAQAIDCLILTPRDIAETEELLFDGPALARNGTTLHMIVIAATLSPRYVRALRARIPSRIALVDAPFNGSLRAAGDGRLTFFLGGAPEEIAALAPIFRCLGQQTLRMGAFGAASAAKVMNDFLAASSSTLTRIALDWAGAQGIDEERLLDIAGVSLDRLLMPGYDLTGRCAADFGGDDCVTALARNVEAAFESALSGAHLTPPQATGTAIRSMKSRSLH